MNKQIVRLLLKYTETMSHEGRLIQIIPNGYIEEIAHEILLQIKNHSDLSNVSNLLPSDSENYSDSKNYALEMADKHGHDYNSAFAGFRNCWKRITKYSDR
jgi:hypothetical protein